MKRWIPACAGMTLLLLAAAAQAKGAVDAVDPAVCQALVENVPDADVNYTPGVDADGNAVAPADLPDEPRMQLPKKIKIPLTLNLAKALNLDTSAYPYSQLGSGTEATLGTIEVEGGRVTFNGKPLTSEQQDNLAVICMQPR